MQRACLSCGDQQRQRIAGVLSAAQGNLSRAEHKLGFIALVHPNLAAVWNRKLAELRRNQANLVGALGYSQRPQDANLGFVLTLTTGLIIGGAALVSAIGGLAFRQYQKTKEVEKRFDAYTDAVGRGMKPDEAMKYSTGLYLPITGTIGKLTGLVVVVGGLYLISKLL